MTRSRVFLLTVTTIALAAAAPAGAITGYGASGPLRVSMTAAVTKSGAEQKHTCQAKSGNQKTPKTQTLVGTTKKPAVVACEQPPRSHVVAQGLKQTATAALAALG